MQNQKNISFYDDHYLDSERIGSEKKTQSLNFVNKLDLKQVTNKRLLDVGCGNGILAEVLKNQFGYIPSGIDLSQVGIRQAKKRGVNAKYHNFNERWPYSKDSFSIVTALQVLEHVYDPDFFLTESKRVLKKNGLLAISTPNLGAWYNRILLLFGYQPFFLEVSTVDKTIGLKFTKRLTPNREPMGHIRVFTYKALEEILELHGFEVLTKRGGSVAYFPRSMRVVDKVVSQLPSLATDLIFLARKR